MSIYTRFQPDDIVEANPTTITTGLWSSDSGSLEGNSVFLYSTQLSNSGDYYFDVYNLDPASSNLAEVQFAVTYGHISGAGAPTLTDSDQATLSTKAIYSQYKNLLLDPSDTKFSFQGVESDHIYVINIQRARVREQLDPGNWQLPLSGTRGRFTFVDDSNQTLGALTANSKAGRVFNVVSGSIIGTSGYVTASTNSTTFSGSGYGLVYPDLGIIVLNPNAIGHCIGMWTSSSRAAAQIGAAASPSQSTAFYTISNLTTETIPYAPVTHSIATFAAGTAVSAYNHTGLYLAIKGAISGSVLEFRARSAETISSTHYFVRLRNKEYNYSNNPTFYNSDTGALIQSDFKNDPRTYITTVGLYNDQNELLAVAKLSKPLRKSFDEEVLLRVRLDF